MEDVKASNSELCQRAHALAKEIRLFQYKYETEERATLEDYSQKLALAKTEEERKPIYQARADTDFKAYQNHSVEFNNRYISDAKYLRDLLINRIPPKTVDLLRQNNGQAESSLTVSNTVGAFPEYMIASYLDELANAACPETEQQKKARLSEYQTIDARLHEFESQGNDLHKRCDPTSTNPPSQAEIDNWINKANKYVQSTRLGEDVKAEFEDVGLGDNVRYWNTAPGCEYLVGEILTRNTKLFMLEHSLEIH